MWKKLPLLFLPVLLVSSGAWSYEGGPVSSGGMIKGKVTYTGSVPMRKIIPTKDQEVCGGIRDEQQVIVGPDSGVTECRCLPERGPEGQAVGQTERDAEC